MEPLTTSAVIGGLVTYLAKKLGDHKNVKDFLKDFSQATVDWVRPLFLTDDGEETEAVTALREKPGSESRQLAVQSQLAGAVEDQPALEQRLRAMFEEMRQTEEGGRIANQILNSKNVNTGNVNTGGGNFRIGD